MSFDRAALIAACHAHGSVTRVVVAAVRGSAPRDVGAAMLVWDAGQQGTIGGGTLEYEATKMARSCIKAHLSTHLLGPDMGQCCGGAVKLWSEPFDLEKATALSNDIIVSGPVAMDTQDLPLDVSRHCAKMRNGSAPRKPQLIGDWMLEPVTQATRDLWIWGAGHVGRALVDVFAPLPDIALHWVDTSTDRFPAHVPDGVTALPAASPVTLVPFAPTTAQHLVLTYSHSLDLALCDALLRRGFSWAGLIGSDTKWARFRSRLKDMGHHDTSIQQITCPIGSPSFGKHPQEIAIGVAAQLQALAQPIQQKTRALA